MSSARRSSRIQDTFRLALCAVDSDSRILRSFAMLIMIHLHMHIDYLESRIICTIPLIGYVLYSIQVIYTPNHKRHRANVAIEQQTHE